MALYSEKVMDHFTNPRNVGKLDDADGVGEVGNAVCGDIMKIYIKVKILSLFKRLTILHKRLTKIKSVHRESLILRTLAPLLKFWWI